MSIFNLRLRNNIQEQYEVLRKGLIRNTEEAIKYRSLRGFNLQTNILTRLVNRLAVEDYPSLEDYLYDEQDTGSLVRYSKILGCNTRMSYGKLLRDNFFNGTPELVCVVDDGVPYGVLEDINKQRSVTPVRFLAHYGTSINYPLLDGKTYSSVTGYVVIEINVTLLKLRYYNWSMNNLIKGINPSDSDFITTEVLPYMYRSFVDYAVFNIFMRKEIDDSYRFPVPLDDYRHRLLRVVHKTLYKVGKIRQPRKYEDILSFIPALYEKHARDVFSVREEYLSYPVMYKRLMSLMPLFAHLFEFIDVSFSNPNRVIDLEILNNIRLLKNSVGIDRLAGESSEVNELLSSFYSALQERV